ncbi:MAG: hypothetical protein M1840_007802 [Geoglossum simile]|nr:MAG: hypothetical protein M1840_007802 [Geoglossum simile]
MATSTSLKLGPVDLLWGRKLRYENDKLRHENASLRKQFAELELRNTTLHEQVGNLETTTTKRLGILEADHTNDPRWERVEGLVMEIAIRVGILETDQTDLKKELGVLTRKHFQWAEETEQSTSRIKNLESENKALKRQTACAKHSMDGVQDQTRRILDPAFGEELKTGLGSVTVNQRRGILFFQLCICCPITAYAVAKLGYYTAPHRDHSPWRLRETTIHNEIPNPFPQSGHPLTHNTQSQPRQETRRAVLLSEGEGLQNTTPRNSQDAAARRSLELSEHGAAATRSEIPSPPPLPSRSSTRRTTPQPSQRIPQVVTPAQDRSVHSSPPLKNQSARAQNPRNRRAAKQSQGGEVLNFPPQPKNLRKKRPPNSHNPQGARAHKGEKVALSPDSRKLCGEVALDQLQDGTKADRPPHPENHCRGTAPNPPNSHAGAPTLERAKAGCSGQPHEGTPTPLHHRATEFGGRKAPPPENLRKRKASKSPNREGIRPALRELVYCPPQPRYPWPRRFLNSPEH